MVYATLAQRVILETAKQAAPLDPEPELEEPEPPCTTPGWYPELTLGVAAPMYCSPSELILPCEVIKAFAWPTETYSQQSIAAST